MSYLRPISVLLPIIIFLYYLIINDKKVAVLKTVLITFIMFLTLSPWIYRNYKVFNMLIPVSTNGGFNFLMGNHSLATGGLNFDFDYNTKNPDEPQEEKNAYKKAFVDIFNNPVDAIIRMPKKIFFSYLRGDSSITWSLKETKNKLPAIFLSFVFLSTNLFFYIVILLSFLGLVKIIRIKNYHLKVIFLLVYFLIIIIIMVYVGGERYIIPAMPIHFFLFIKFLNNKYESEKNIVYSSSY